jgi:hypothetical protein
MHDLNGAIGGAGSRASVGSGAGKKPVKAPRTLDFVVADDLESTAPIVATAWLGGQVGCACRGPSSTHASAAHASTHTFSHANLRCGRCVVWCMRSLHHSLHPSCSCAVRAFACGCACGCDGFCDSDSDSDCGCCLYHFAPPAGPLADTCVHDL